MSTTNWEVQAPQKIQNGSLIRVHQEVRPGRILWFEVPAIYENFVAKNSDFVAVALLPAAMIEGVDLEIQGEVSELLLYNLNRYVQPLIKVAYPDWRAIEIRATPVAMHKQRPAGVLTGFSAGVDSLSVLENYWAREDVPERVRITHLVNNNVGSFQFSGSSAWSKRQAVLEPVARDIGLPLLAINSNLQDFYPDDLLFKHFHTFANAAVAHLLSDGIGRFLYASAYSYAEVHRAGRQAPLNIAHLDGLLLPLMSTDSLSLQSADPELSRVDKTVAVAAGKYWEYLDVCTSRNPDRVTNCSRCEKCLRTLITIEIAGKIHKHLGFTFDERPYKARRIIAMASVLNANDDLSLSIKHFAKLRDFKWPIFSHIARPIVGPLLRLRRRIRRGAGAASTL